MRKLLIRNEWFFPEDNDAVIDLVDQHMGHDTADVLREIINNSLCRGECNETHKIEEHYKRIIRDAVDDLRDVKIQRAHEGRMARIIKSLEAEL